MSAEHSGESIVCAVCNRNSSSSPCHSCSQPTGGGPVSSSLALSWSSAEWFPSQSRPRTASTLDPDSLEKLMKAQQEHQQRIKSEFENLAEDVTKSQYNLRYIPVVVGVGWGRLRPVIWGGIKRRLAFAAALVGATAILIGSCSGVKIGTPWSDLPDAPGSSQQSDTYRFDNPDRLFQQRIGRDDRSSLRGRCAGIWAQYMGVENFDAFNGDHIRRYEQLKAENSVRHDNQVNRCVDYIKNSNDISMFDGPNFDYMRHFTHDHGKHLPGGFSIGTVNNFKEALNWNTFMDQYR